jgi:hypothetical protein
MGYEDDLAYGSRSKFIYLAIQAVLRPTGSVEIRTPLRQAGVPRIQPLIKESSVGRVAIKLVY